MPYLFPGENLFVSGISLLIVVLLMVRFRLTRNRDRPPAASASSADSDHAAPSNQADQADRVQR